MDLRPLFGPAAATTSNPCPDSTFNVLRLNANGIGNKLTEIGAVLESNNVKVAVIQESKISSKSKNPYIQNYTTVRVPAIPKCSGLLNAAQYRRNEDWTCDPCSSSKTQQLTPPPPSPPPTPVPSVEQISDYSTFNVLQFNANRQQTDITRSSIGEKQCQSGGYTGVKALVKIQEPLHPELHHST